METILMHTPPVITGGVTASNHKHKGHEEVTKGNVKATANEVRKRLPECLIYPSLLIPARAVSRPARELRGTTMASVPGMTTASIARCSLVPLPSASRV